MNQVASILGIDLSPFKARSIVMKSSASSPPRHKRKLHLRDSLMLLEKSDQPMDDDTASTASASDSDSVFSFMSTESHSVSFADPLVTDVITRPYTTIRDKFDLYYSNHDYAEFRREAYGYQRREKLVKFADSMVTDVWTIPEVEDASSMYYSKKELQRFLDEFIASLDDSACAE